MKLGIYLQEITPESGGAFTFAETIISGLLRSEIKDSITVFHYGTGGKLKEQFSSHTSFHTLGTPGSSRLIKKIWYDALIPLLQRILFRASRMTSIKLPYPASSPLDRAARTAGVDLLWFPTPNAEQVECPYIITVWDLEHRAQPYFPEVSAKGEWRGRETYFQRSLPRASYVIAGTEVGKQEIIRAYGIHPDRVRLLPHPTPSFALAAGSKLPLPERLQFGHEYVLYPAQFWAHKNHIGLLEAIAELKKQNVEMHCALVGSDKGNRSHVETHAKNLGIGAQIHFLGFVSREELIALYQNAVALVYPSLCGPENLPPLEAMALGCPVIAADIAGAREQLGDAALLVSAVRPHLFADAIRTLLESPVRRQELIEKGLRRARRYTEREFLGDLTGILNEFRAIRRTWSKPN